jgi:hypothetical protein
MRIPSHNFGNRLPELVRRDTVSGQGIDAAAHATERLGDTVAQLASNNMTRQQQETEALARAKAGNTLLDREIQIKTINGDLEKRLMDGSLPYDKAEDAYTTAIQKLDIVDVDGIDDVTRENFSKGLKRLEFSGLESTRSMVERAKIIDYKNQVDSALDKLSALTAYPDADPAKINAQLDSLSMLGEGAYGKQWGNVTRKFRNEWSRGKVRRDITNNPSVALDNIRNNQYESLSFEEQSQFEAMAISAMKQDDVKADYTLKKQSAEMVSNTILSYEKGYPVTEEEYAAATEAATVIGKEKDLQIARVASQFILLPKKERDGIPEQIKGVNSVELRLGLEKANETIDRELKKDGYAFAVRQGVVENIPLNLQDPASFKARLEQVDYLKSHYQQEVSPLTNTEADALVQMLPVMSSMAKAEMAAAFGPSKAIWAQLDKKNAGTFAMVGAIGDKAVMQTVFEGQQKLTNGLTSSLSKKDYLNTFDDYVGSVYVGDDRKNMLDAALAYYSAKSNGDSFEASDFEEAIDAVSGGIAKINGAKIELPRGVDEDVFEDYIDRFDGETVGRYGGVFGLNNDEAAKLIHKAQLKSVGSNRYMVIVDNAKLTTNTGENFIISFDPEIKKQQDEKFKKSLNKNFSRVKTGG